MTNITVSLKYLWQSLASFNKRKIILLFLLNIVNAVAEVVSIGSIIPIVSLMMNESNILKYPMLDRVLSNIPGLSHNKVLALLVVFAMITIIVGVIRYVTLVFTNKLAFSISSNVAVKVYSNALYKPYPIHLKENSSEMISDLTIKINSMISGIFIPLLTFVNSFFIVFSILVALFVISPMVATVIVVVFGGAYWIISKRAVKKLHLNSGLIVKLDEKLIKLIQESLGGIREINLEGNQKYYIKTFSAINTPLRNAQSENVIAGTSPRYFVETLGIITICAVAILSVSFNHSGSDIFPVIAAFAFSAQRILPTAQLLYTSWSSLVGNSVAMNRLANEVRINYKGSESSEHNKMDISVGFEFKDVSFQYDLQHPNVIQNVNLNIPVGSRIGVVGKTGMGKTTLMDILMGLLEPTSGQILIDGVELTQDNIKKWRNAIAHVPQNIYLSDLSIKDNIAFGLNNEEIDMERVHAAAKKAQLHDFIMQLPEKYDTQVGERGVRLSGGQRQRIGIARALYKQAEIVIFDEATSALDSETEEKIMQSIYESGDNVTLFIIAHRVSTLRLVNTIFEVKNKKVMIHDSYDGYVLLSQTENILK
ncbi:MAG: ABC transporter ATP-binding protein [Sphingobacteriaceae bacterium]|nr:ABC transporter ATP-binding protein [Sphingobacteriaceae bacterium]